MNSVWVIQAADMKNKHLIAVLFEVNSHVKFDFLLCTYIAWKLWLPIFHAKWGRPQKVLL